MNPSPLQLRHSQYWTISLIANDLDPAVLENADTPYPELLPDAIRTKVVLGAPPDQDNPKDFAVTVAVTSIDDKLPPSFPYRFATKIEGFFTIEHDGDLEERKRLVVVNGAGMLFGAIREQFLTLSLRHKNGPLLLPSLDFRSLGPRKPPEPPADVKAVQGKQKGVAVPKKTRNKPSK